MTLHKDVIKSIEKSPRGPKICAIFDFDGTIIAGYSATVFLKAQLRRGDLTLFQFIELLTVIAQMQLGKVGFSGLMTTGAQLMQGVTEKSYREFGEDLFVEQIAQRIYPESRSLIEAHRKRGHTIAIISAATPYQVEPAAKDLGIEHVMCSRYEVSNGEFTGNINHPLCFGEGKVQAAEDLAEKLNLNLDKSYFYSDSDDDIELLDRIGNPQVMNPNKRLHSIAMRRGWPIRQFTSRGRPTFSERVRSAAAVGSLVTSFVAGLPILGLTGSKSESVNFSVSLFADIASALINLRLDVTNERYLWINRPCVFVFNHQSAADVVIMAKLVRKDMISVGKKEIGDVPILGSLFQYGGTVLIDRDDSSGAIDSMQPLIDKIRNEKKCLCIAPEGTRSHSNRLQPFKKGAFHIAMQAGVPIVPIVIHNATDVMAKGENVFRSATVKVDVLKPIDTSKWKVADIPEQAEQLQKLFLKTLNQETVSVPRKKKPSKAKTKTKTKTNKKTADKTTRKKSKVTRKKSTSSKKKASTRKKRNTKA